MRPEETRKNFFQAIFGDSPYNIELRAILSGSKPESKFFKPADFIGMERFIKKYVNSRNLFFGVYPRDGRNGTKEGISQATCLFMDLDFKHLPGGAAEGRKIVEQMLPPSAIVHSGNGYHVYWIFNEHVEAISGIEAYLKGVAKRFDGDIKVAELARILRVPGTINHKDGKKKPVVLEKLNGERYNLSDFDDLKDESTNDTGMTKKSVDLKKLTEKCSFIKFCDENRKDLPEPLWYAMVSNLSRISPGGPSLVHEISRGYPGYTRAETDQKILHAINSSGPHTCQNIKETMQSFIGKDCEQDCKVISPVVLLNRNDSSVVDNTCEEEPSIEPEKRTLIECYGEPYYVKNKKDVYAINEAYWAGLYDSENVGLYEPAEKTFYHYNPDSGLYEEISQDAIRKDIGRRMLEVARTENHTLEMKRTDTLLKAILSQLKGIREQRGAFKKKSNIVHLANGVIVFNDNTGEADLCEFSPVYCSRNQSPISFDPHAQCERFLNELIYPAVSDGDAVLIQKYAGMCLLGSNLIQRLLILDGLPGRGKTQLCLVIQKLIGQVNVGELRTNHLSERFELYRFLRKTLLVGVDVPGNFLSAKGSYVIKGLVGGDYFDAEQKGGTGSFPIQGNLCIIVTSNSRLQVRLDGDIGAWRRRLLIVRYEAPPPKVKIPNFAELLIREEGSGILNWALSGMGMLLDEIKRYGDIQLTESQGNIVDSLLAESDSLRIFLKENVENDDNGDLSVSEIVEAYAIFCTDHGWTAKPITIVHNELEHLMLELFHTTRCHSIKREGTSIRGFRHIRFSTRKRNNAR